MRMSDWRALLVLLAAVPAVAVGQAAPAPSPAVVNTVLFFSPSCPHCHKVMTEDLPPLVRRYGGRLRVATVDVSTVGGQALYQATVAYFGLPDDRLGVPTLVVGTRVLVGSLEIPQELPGIVDRGLAAGGIGWPEVPAIRSAIARAEQAEAQRQAPAESVAAAPPAPAAVAAGGDSARAGARDTAGAGAAAERAAAPAQPSPAAAAAPGPGRAAEAPQRSASSAPAGVQDSARSPSPDAAQAAAAPAAGPMALGEATDAPSARERFLRDPVGNAAAVVVLLAMVVALGVVALALLGRRVALPTAAPWVVPVLALGGLGVAGYLAVVEVTGVRAVCGPVGDCNIVQQSAYARLFGVLPIGVLGMVGYVGMIGAWALAVVAPARIARLATLGGWAMALVGTVFSVYLTFLEPFVIGATCAWCLTSAAIITLLLLVLTPEARRELRDAPAGSVPGTP